MVHTPEVALKTSTTPDATATTDSPPHSTNAETVAPASPAQKERLARLAPDEVEAKQLAGEAIRAILTNAPGNGEPIGGLKVVADNGWFAVRPSGTEHVYKLYAESFLGRDHLSRIQEEAQALVARLFLR